LPGIFGSDAGVKVAPGTLERFKRTIERANVLGIWYTVQIITRRDFTGNPRRFGNEGNAGVPSVSVAWESGCGVPYEASAWVVQELVARAEVKVYEKTAHGMCVTYVQMIVVEVVEILSRLDK
jgi:hypothetical protein